MSDPVSRLNAALEGRYRIEHELGDGGMATVYLADDLKLGDSEQALEQYRRMVDLWPDPDPELRHIPDQAVARISAL